LANLSSESEDIRAPFSPFGLVGKKNVPFVRSVAGSIAEPAHGDVLVLIGENCLFAFTAE
jgi:hypothetical protein